MSKRANRNAVTTAWMERLGVSGKVVRKERAGASRLTVAQLGMCKSDEARRLILGISQQVEDTGYRPYQRYPDPLERIKELAASRRRVA